MPIGYNNTTRCIQYDIRSHLAISYPVEPLVLNSDLGQAPVNLVMLKVLQVMELNGHGIVSILVELLLPLGVLRLARLLSNQVGLLLTGCHCV